MKSSPYLFNLAFMLPHLGAQVRDFERDMREIRKATTVTKPITFVEGTSPAAPPGPTVADMVQGHTYRTLDISDGGPHSRHNGLPKGAIISVPLSYSWECTNEKFPGIEDDFRPVVLLGSISLGLVTARAVRLSTRVEEVTLTVEVGR